MNSDELPWTGERLVTSIKEGDIVLEHLHRYAFAAELVAGKDVLDIACGEGYGSHLLAAAARSVVGVDISGEAVHHAQKKYIRSNLAFQQGSCVAIPIPTQSVDVVVSFETLEHFTEQDQFLTEVRRVLRPAGILIISTPDQAIYTGKLGNQNQFHPKELGAADFETLLRGHFTQVKTLSQRVALGSFLAPTANDQLIETGTFRGDYETVHFIPGAAEGVYLIGVASDAPLPVLKAGLFEFGREKAGVFLTPLAAQRQREGEQLARQRTDLEHYLAERDRQIVQLNQKIQLLNQMVNSVSQFQAENQKNQLLNQMMNSVSQFQADSVRSVDELKKNADEQRQKIHGLDQVVASAEQWQRRSWFKRAFHRWRPPGAKSEPTGFFKKLERSLRKRRKRLFDQKSNSARAGATQSRKLENPPIKPVGFFKKLERSVRKRRKRFFNQFGKENSILEDQAPDFSPRVTVIVPNFNHAAYLRKRLDSIYQQTYRHFNVLLLDDGSGDGSLKILQEYAAKHPANTKIIRNQTNGGTPFKQWKRGILEADGELLWIAESDDFCDVNFLKTLVPFFQDPAMSLAFCRTDFVDECGEAQMSYPQYVEDLGAEKWAQDYVATAHNVVNQALGIKNIIPNASGVLFKKPRHLPLLDDPAWLQMKICGDWIFYLHLMRGGKVGFSQKTKNYYRFHANNASAYKNHQQPFYFKEHATVAKTVARLYKVGDSLFDKSQETLRRYWEQVWQGSPPADWTLDDCYQLSEIKAEQAKRRPNILIACHDFGGGGGEMFPIRLANELHEQGEVVVFYDFNGLPANAEFKKNLLPDLPLISGNNEIAFIAAQLKDFGIDVVHTHHLMVDLFFSQAISILKDEAEPIPKQVVTLHGMYEISMEFFKEQQGKLIPRIDHWVYTADKNLEPFREVGNHEAQKFSKIPLGIKIQRANRLDRRHFNVPATAFLVCVASRAIPEKGWVETIEAIELARAKSGKNIHLLLAGDGPMKDALSQRSLPPYIHLLGYQKDIVSLYAMADIGLLASNYKGESCPLTIIECLSAERPVIATALGEIPAMLNLTPKKAAGILVELENWELPVATLAEAVCRYATDEIAYHAAAANCLESAKKYSMDLIAKKYAGIFNDLFHGRKPAE